MHKVILRVALAALTFVAAATVVPAPAQAALSSCNSFTTAPNPAGWEDMYLHVPSLGGQTGNYNCVLGQGNSGIAVTVLQEALVSCYGQNIAIDGDFGPATKQALKNAQTYVNEHYYAGLVVDGVYGPKTHDNIIFAAFRGSGAILWGWCYYNV